MTQEKKRARGSAEGTSDAFLDEASPEVAVISVGVNSYGHPSPATLGRLEAHGAEIYRTDLSGTIRVTTDGSGWKVS